MSTSNPGAGRPVVLFLAVAGFLSIGLAPANAATLPAGVSEIIRELGELREVTWNLLELARKSHATNESALGTLKERYIEASAAANSLIEQFQIETAARTPMNERRYRPTIERVKQRCESFTNEYHKLMMPPTRTRAASTASTSSSTGSGAGSGSNKAPSANLTNSGTLTLQGSIDMASRSITIADNFLGIVAKHQRAFRELDVQQRQEVRTLLEQRKWRPLDSGAPNRSPGNAVDAEPRQNRTGADQPVGAPK